MKSLTRSLLTAIDELATAPSDIWIMDLDGSDPRLLVPNAAFPAWNPASL